MVVKEENVRLTITVEREFLEHVDRIAEKAKVSRNKILQAILYSGLDDLKVLEMMGIPKLIGIIKEGRALVEVIHSRLER